MSLRRTAAVGVVLLTAVLLQVTVLPLVAGGGFVPDLVAVVLVVLTLEAGPRLALWAAGFAGVVVDLLAVTVPLGSSVLVYATVVYGLGLLRPYLSERADLTTAILAGFAGVVSMMGHGGLQVILSDQTTLPGSVVWRAAIVVGAFAVLLAPVALGIVRRVLRATDVSAAERTG
jgi:rod shape-determining protein MreD